MECLFPALLQIYSYFLFWGFLLSNRILGESKGKLMCVYILSHLEVEAGNSYKRKRKIMLKSCGKGEIGKRDAVI